MKWVLYNILFTIGYLLLLPRFLLRMRKRGGYRHGFGERFGCYPADTLAALAGRRPVWIHAVSVGEVAVAARCMQALRAARPDLRFVLSVTTSTGRAMARPHVKAGDALIYFPVDFPPIARRVCRQLNPCLLILIEGELWPNLIRRLDHEGVPVAVMNGRLSARSFAGYRRVRIFFAEILSRIRLFLVQTDDDRDRLAALGAPVDRLTVTGSVKFDPAPVDPDAADHARQLIARAGIPATARLVVGGSTWPGEELALAHAVRRARDRTPDVRLVLVPRHAERRVEIRDALDAAGYPFVLRSTLDTDTPPADDPDILVVDSTGELAGFYALAEVVFIGKSLGDNHGGQNLIEPAALGKPVITGPHMENFPGVIHAFRAAEAVVEVHDADALAHALEDLLAHPERAARIGERAGALVARNRGALAQSLPHLLALLPESDATP